jgi:hypothetical protein
MRIEAKLRIKDKPLDKFYDLEVGDQITVPDPIGENWVKNGWAKNLDTGEENPPSDNPVTLDIESATHATASTEV